jgi:hypothetical protein
MQRSSYFQFINKFISSAILLTAMFSVVSAQETISVSSSKLLNAKLPPNASMINKANVPSEFNQTFDYLLKEGEGKISGGEREVLAWTNKSEFAKLVRQIQTNFRNANWQYESTGSKDGVEFFNLYKEGSPRRVLIGFFVQTDDVVICALMEVFQTNSAKTIQPISTKTNSSAKVLNADKNTKYINVMGNEMPAIPSFPTLSPKPGKVRGYVKDWSGKPLAGANIGVRSSYFAGYYSGGQGTTDANGYYELTPPKGSAHFYNAGYQINFGDGVAAVSLHPADGKLESWTTIDGNVENFVLLPFGITNRENLQNSSHLPSTFYGGAIFLTWYGVEADDNNAPPFAIREGSTVEITLTPEGKMLDGSAGQTVVIRKVAGTSGEIRIHNIPLGRYRIAIKANGKSVKVKDTQKFNQTFGMSPAEANGSASILFVPNTADAKMVTPQFGAWKWISLSLETL